MGFYGPGPLGEEMVRCVLQNAAGSAVANVEIIYRSTFTLFEGLDQQQQGCLSFFIVQVT